MNKDNVQVGGSSPKALKVN